MRKYGIEIEFNSVNKTTVVEKMNQAGINTQDEDYNHTTRAHWKMVTDSSCGTDTEKGLELVSPILTDEQGQQQITTA